MKDFDEWIILKKDLDKSVHKPPYVSEGDIWWASVGENVGSEIGGKSNLFSRPVIIFRKLAHGFYFVIPTTTKKRQGSWYVSFKHKGQLGVASLHQTRSIDYRRFYNKLGTLDDSDFLNIKEGFKKLYIK